MTRDEARSIYLHFNRILDQCSSIEEAVEAMIDTDLALGYLKLDDEPKGHA